MSKSRKFSEKTIRKSLEKCPGIKDQDDVVDSIIAYTQKYSIEKQEDLKCVEGVGNAIAKHLAKDLQLKFVQNGRSACLRLLPPHVRKITKQCQGSIRPTKNCMTIIHVNINGLTTKLSTLFSYIKQAAEKKPGIICVSEANIDFETRDADVQLEGYKSFLRYNLNESGRSCGGVAMYVRDGLRTKQINTLRFKNLDFDFKKALAETMWVEVTNAAGCSITVGVVYRHPNNKEKHRLKFQDVLKKYLQKMTKKEEKVYVLGDINFNLIKHNHYYIDYCEMLFSRSFRLLITKPTKKKQSSDDSGSLLDHIYTNDHRRINAGSISFSKISDHDLVHCCIKFKVQ